MAILTSGTWPNVKSERITTPVASDIRQLEIQHNLLLTNLSTYFATIAGAVTSNYVLQPVTMSRGTTVTYSLTLGQVAIFGVPVTGFAAQLNQAFGALGTIPANKWGLVAVDVVGNGTITLVSAAANYTTGYATEALAIAAIPAVTAGNARVCYATVLASASTFIFATDSLAGGVTGNPATTTNYYSIPSIYDTTLWTASQIGNLAGTALDSTKY
jgi:hypothetical protein